MRWIVAVLLSVAAGACLVGLTLSLRVTLPLVARGRAATGTIRSYEQGESSSDGEAPPVYPVIHFSTPDGKDQSFRSNMGGGGQPIGQKVAVLYDPENPSRARLDTWQALWLGAGLAAGMALVCAGALAALVKIWKVEWTPRTQGEL